MSCPTIVNQFPAKYLITMSFFSVENVAFYSTMNWLSLSFFFFFFGDSPLELQR